jgi:hypothetical protein
MLMVRRLRLRSSLFWVDGQHCRNDSVSWRKIRIYKRRKSRTFFSLDWKEEIFPCFQPLRVRRGLVVLRILHGSISVASLLSGDYANRFLELASRGGCLVGNT